MRTKPCCYQTHITRIDRVRETELGGGANIPPTSQILSNKNTNTNNLSIFLAVISYRSTKEITYFSGFVCCYFLLLVQKFFLVYFFCLKYLISV